MTKLAPEKARPILGVAGRAFDVHLWPDDPKIPERARGRIASQTWKSETRKTGTGTRLRVNVRFDDNCKNGRESFAITGEEYDARGNMVACGCLHDKIARTFPELAPLVAWHLCATDGPMHYLANTVYHASDRDHYGLLAGESRQIRNGRTGLPCWKLEAVTADGAPFDMIGGKTFDGETPPAAPVLRWVPWLRIGEGKARDLDAARASAIWPDAPDSIMTAPPDELRAALVARLPRLVADFRRAMVEDCGFLWIEAAGQEGGAA